MPSCRSWGQVKRTLPDGASTRYKWIYLCLITYVRSIWDLGTWSWFSNYVSFTLCCCTYYWIRRKHSSAEIEKQQYIVCTQKSLKWSEEFFLKIHSQFSWCRDKSKVVQIALVRGFYPEFIFTAGFFFFLYWFSARFYKLLLKDNEYNIISGITSDNCDFRGLNPH